MTSAGQDVGSTARRESISTRTELSRESLARDIEEYSDHESHDTESDPDPIERASTSVRKHSLVGSYRRASVAGAGNRPILFSRSNAIDRLTLEERERALEEQSDLLRDNKIVPLQHSNTSRALSGMPVTESSPLLAGTAASMSGGRDDPEQIGQKWNDAVEAGMIHTTWQREAKTLAGYSLPLVVIFLLQYSLTVASILTVGHIGKVELGAVSLASMTANITGYAIYQGLATSLDTLCAQAYGCGKKRLVGLQLQRMVYFLWLVTVPVGIVWLYADKILAVLVPEHEVARLAGLYLKVALAGAPGYAAFEAGKRYVQAQGLFTASLYVLLVCAPLNAFLNWFFVWRLEMGFVGAPLAVAITDTLLPIGLYIYVRLSKTAMSCWGGFTRKAFSNWGPMIRLALPGMIMVEAEMVAFEVLTFASSYFGTTELAAQSVIATLAQISYQIPFPLSIAASTRVGNLIGATLTDAARVSTRVTFFAALAIGLVNVTILSSLRSVLPRLFTSDPDVVDIVSRILPLVSTIQLCDSLAACCNGILRGLGRQEFGGYTQVFCYYVVAMPISFGTAFGLDWQLWGLWTGVGIAQVIVVAVELTYLFGFLDWEKSVEEATIRNMTE